MKTDEFKALARIRNGVETLPSILRNRYHVDRMSVRGKIRIRSCPDDREYKQGTIKPIFYSEWFESYFFKKCVKFSRR